jgi:glucose-1-phosphate cytidylyltransferase
VSPPYSVHTLHATGDGTVTAITNMSSSGVRINGGYFVFRREIFDWIQPGDELVEETFSRLIPHGEIRAIPHHGFYGPMDTIKDRQLLENLYESGSAPWRRVGAAGDRVAAVV